MAASVLSPLFTYSSSFHWVFVRQRFTALLENLAITADQVEDGETKHRGVVASLNRAYWNVSDERANGLLIGSWGKRTRVRPPRDVDLLFVLPVNDYWRLQGRTGNLQSQLLQEVKDVLRETYPNTDVRGDGQVVVVPFNTYAVEVAPAFPAQGGGYYVCDTHDGGRYKLVDPLAEMSQLDLADRRFNGNARKLARIMKQWQRECNVPIKSFHIERLVTEFLSTTGYGCNDEFWFDWLVRDLLAYIVTRANGWFVMPGAGAEVISLGADWLGRAEMAYARAVKACGHEYNNEGVRAGEEWQKIFGSMIPLVP